MNVDSAFADSESSNSNHSFDDDSEEEEVKLNYLSTNLITRPSIYVSDVEL
jgi:hypothetical protein